MQTPEPMEQAGRIPPADELRKAAAKLREDPERWPALAEPPTALIERHRVDCAIMRVQPGEDWLALARAINGEQQ